MRAERSKAMRKKKTAEPGAESSVLELPFFERLKLSAKCIAELLAFICGCVLLFLPAISILMHSNKLPWIWAPLLLAYLVAMSIGLALIRHLLYGGAYREMQRIKDGSENERK